MFVLSLLCGGERGRDGDLVRLAPSRAANADATSGAGITETLPAGDVIHR
jgi:hypothetical protein